jgi:hypothetical protein
MPVKAATVTEVGTLLKAQAWAAERGLAALPAAFPSWWDPSSTTPVMLTLAGEIIEFFRALHRLSEPDEVLADIIPGIYSPSVTFRRSPVISAGGVAADLSERINRPLEVH